MAQHIGLARGRQLLQRADGGRVAHHKQVRLPQFRQQLLRLSGVRTAARKGVSETGERGLQRGPCL